MGNTLTIYQVQRQYKRLLLFFPKLIFPGAVLISLGLHSVVLMWPLPEKPEEEEVVEEEFIEEVPIAILDVPAESETKSSNKEIPLPSFSSPPSTRTIPPVQPQPIQEDFVIEPIEVETVSDVDKKDDLPEEYKSNNKGVTSSDSEEDSDSEESEEDDKDTNGNKGGDGKKLEELKAKTKSFTENYVPTGSLTGKESFVRTVGLPLSPLASQPLTPQQKTRFTQQMKLFFSGFDGNLSNDNWFDTLKSGTKKIGIFNEKSPNEIA